MLYQLIVKIVGADILWALTFLPFNLSYHDNTFTLHASMRQPITGEIEALVKKGLDFRIEQTVYLIINEKKSYNRTVNKELTWNNGWMINGKRLYSNDIQAEMGSISYSTGDFRFDNGDVILVYVEYKILPDNNFTGSTGLKTQVLWKFYTPSSKQIFSFNNGAFTQQ